MLICDRLLRVTDPYGLEGMLMSVQRATAWYPLSWDSSYKPQYFCVWLENVILSWLTPYRGVQNNRKRNSNINNNKIIERTRGDDLGDTSWKGSGQLSLAQLIESIVARVGYNSQDYYRSLALDCSLSGSPKPKQRIRAGCGFCFDLGVQATKRKIGRTGLRRLGED